MDSLSDFEDFTAGGDLKKGATRAETIRSESSSERGPKCPFHKGKQEKRARDSGARSKCVTAIYRFGCLRNRHVLRVR